MAMATQRRFSNINLKKNHQNLPANKWQGIWVQQAIFKAASNGVPPVCCFGDMKISVGVVPHFSLRITRVPFHLHFICLLMKLLDALYHIFHHSLGNSMINHLKESPCHWCFADMAHHFCAATTTLKALEIYHWHLKLAGWDVCGWDWLLEVFWWVNEDSWDFDKSWV